MQIILNNVSGQFFRVFNWIQKRRWIQLAINILLILFLFGYVGTYLAKDWGQLSKLKVTLNFQAILLSFAYYGLNYILLTLSWHVLFKAFNAKVGWWDNLMFYS